MKLKMNSNYIVNTSPSKLHLYKHDLLFEVASI